MYLSGFKLLLTNRTEFLPTPSTIELNLSQGQSTEFFRIFENIGLMNFFQENGISGKFSVFEDF